MTFNLTRNDENEISIVLILVQNHILADVFPTLILLTLYVNCVATIRLHIEYQNGQDVAFITFMSMK